MKGYSTKIQSVDVKRGQRNASILLTFSNEVKATEKTTEHRNIRGGLFSRWGKSIKSKSDPLGIDFTVNSTVTSEITTSSNVLSISIEPQIGRRFTRTISGGNYDFMGGIDAGYDVIIKVDTNDGILLNTAMSVIREMGFACHFGDYTVTGHKTDREPTYAEAEHFVDFFVKVMIEAIKDMGVQN